MAAARRSAGACTSDKDCVLSNQLCDKGRSICVDCTDNSSCKPQQTCEKSKRADLTLVHELAHCTVGAVCDKTKMRCVECVMSADCKDGQTCAEGTCRASCTSDKNCCRAT